jgi:site-specific DNA-cytosine methylase
MIFLDLFSGLGGASEAFIDDPNCIVVRIENNPLLSDVPRTNLIDIRSRWVEDYVHYEKPEIIWASPPCLEFSQAFNAPKLAAARAGRPFNPDMGLVTRAKHLIDINEGCIWVIENVVGTIEAFRPLLGEPRQIIGPFVLWGNFPLLHIARDFKHSKYDNGARHDPLRSNIRAKIPLEISEAFRSAIIHQTRIDSW